MEKVPNIRFQGYTDDWEQQKIGDITSVLSASRVHKDEWTDEGVPFYRSSDVVSAYKGITNEKAFISQELYETLAVSSGKLEKDDILVTGGGSIGIPYVVPDDQPLYTKDADLIWVKKSAVHDSKYLFTYFESPLFRNYLISISHTGTISHYTIEQVKATPVALSGIEEQKQIGAYFARLDNLIALHQRKCDELQKVKKYMLQKMFPKKGEKVPEIRFAGFTGDWKQRKLGDIGETYTGLSGKTKDDFGHGEATFVTYMNVYTNPIANKELVESVEIDTSQNEVQYGDVFFTTSSETPDEVGMSCVWLEKTMNTYLNSFCFGYRPTVKIEPYYMAYALRSDVVRKKIIFLAQGISRYNISKNKLMEIEIPLPDIDEQTKIGQHFKNLDNLITLHQRKHDTLKEIKKYMLQNMFPKK